MPIPAKHQQNCQLPTDSWCSVRRNFGGFRIPVFHYGVQCIRITSQRSRSKKIVPSRRDLCSILLRARPHCLNRSVLIVARQQVDPGYIIARHKALDFVQQRFGVLTRRANQLGSAIGMSCGFAMEIYLWKFTAVPWTWWVAIGSLTTFGVGYAFSCLLPQKQIETL